MHSVLTVARPFWAEQKIELPFGLSIQQICERLFGTSEGVVAMLKSPEGALQQWEDVPQAMWRYIKPRGYECLKFFFYPKGGSGRNLFAIAAAVLVSIAAPYLAGALLPGLAAGSIGLALATAGIAIGGNLLVAKLFAPNVPKARSNTADTADDVENAFTDVDSDANVLARGVAPPRIIGHRRVSLPDAMYPHKYLENGIDYIERCLVASGHHEISDIRVNNVSIDTLSDVEYQVRDGQESAPQQTMLNRVTKTKSIDEQFGKFLLASNQLNLSDQVAPKNSEPKEIIFSPGYHKEMEQITIRLSLEPFLFQSNPSLNIRLPFRVTLRDKAGVLPDLNLPEIHITGRKSSAVPKEIRIRRDSNFGFVAASDYSVDFYNRVPATSSTLSNGHTGDQWVCHSAFSAGSGIQQTKNISATLDSINVTLPKDDIPWADFEVIIRPGLAFVDTNFAESTYFLSGSVQSLFYAKNTSGSWVIPISIEGVFAGISVEWATLIVKRKPVEISGVAQIALRFRGVNATNITCLAGAYVNDWGGSDWDNLVITKNPAPHFRHQLIEGQKFSRVSTTLNRDDEFLAWRQECAARGYEVNYVASGQALNEVLNQIAIAGFADRSFGAGYGITFHRDRANETPEMSFSHRDSKISYNRIFPDIPKGYMVDFDDETNDFKNDGPITINNPYGYASLEANEQVSYASITNPDLIERRAVFDMLLVANRQKSVRIETGPAGFSRKRGDLIGVVSDLDTDHAHGFFIRQVLDSKTVAVDRAVPAQDEDYITGSADITQIEDLLVSGAVSVAHVLTPEGIEVYTVANVSGNTIRFVETIPDSWIVNGDTYPRSILQGSRMTVAARNDLFQRFLVTEVARKSEGRAVITAVPEAPEIEEEITRLYG